MRLRLGMLRVACVFGCVAVLSVHGMAQPPRGEDCEAVDLLPQSILMCAEVPNLGAVLQQVVDHPLRSRIEAMPAYKTAEKAGGLKQLQVAIKTFEASMEQTWQAALTTLADRGATIAFDSREGGVALLLHSSDIGALERLYNFALTVQLLQGKAATQGDYRGFTAHSLRDDLKMVRMYDWLLLTNKSTLGKAIIDQYLDRKEATLANSKRFAEAWKSARSPSQGARVISGFVDIEQIRAAGIAKKIYEERVENLLAEVLFGGILSDLRRTDYSTLALDLEPNRVSLKFAVPHEREWEPPREYYFGEPELKPAPELLGVADQLFAVSAYRDLSQMWLRSGELVSDKAVDQLAVADTQLTTFFSGRDFGEDILGALHSGLQIVGKMQDYQGVLPQPAIKLPAFAMQFKMKNAEDTQPELRRVFQSLVGFINVTAAMNGQPQLDLGMEKSEGIQLVTATFLPKRDQRESRDAAIQFNFSPTLAFSGDRVILSSSTQLARELLERNDPKPVQASVTPNETKPDSQPLATNTIAELNTTTLQRLLQANRTQLVSNNMLEKGHGQAAAEAEIDLLLELIGFMRSFQLKLDVSDSTMQVAASVDIALPEKGQTE